MILLMGMCLQHSQATQSVDEGHFDIVYAKILPLKPEEGVFAYSRISPDGNYLSYASEVNDGGKLKRTVNFISLRERKVLFAEPGLDSYWSPDGKRIIFLSGEGGENASVSIWHLDTGKVFRNIAPASLGDYFSWAIAGGRDLIMTKANHYFYLEGDKALRPYRTVPKYPAFGTGQQPMISKDGRLIATFVNGTLVVRGLEETAPLIETHLSGGKADFSYDSRYIAFHTLKSGGESDEYEVVVVDLQERKLIHATNLPGSCYYPSWTRDGRLSFRHDSADYRGFMMASNFLRNKPEPLPESQNTVEQSSDLKNLYGFTQLCQKKIVLVNFWAGWCVHCRGELPHLNRLRQLLLKDGLDAEIVGACDPSSFISDRDEIIKRNHLELPQLNVTPRQLQGFGVQMYPTSLMFVNGKLAERRYGSQTFEQFVDWFESKGIHIRQ